MSLKPIDLTPIPEETARIAKAAFPKGNIYLKLRDELDALYQERPQPIYILWLSPW
jgi:transposase